MVAASLALVAGFALGSADPGDVKWNKGSGPTQMSKGLPDPPGWYRAAIGPRTDDKVLYLTFDDGPSRFTPSLLHGLRRHNVSATFFVSGSAAARQPAVIRRMHRDGHAIGNHTWSHPRLTAIPTSQVRKQLLRTVREIGTPLSPCMRPPYGLINEAVARVALAAGFQPVMWTGHIDDWDPHPQRWTIRTLRAITAPGAVILMHDTHQATVSAVRALLPWWQKRGYRFEVVPTCDSPIPHQIRGTE